MDKESIEAARIAKWFLASILGPSRIGPELQDRSVLTVSSLLLGWYANRFDKSIDVVLVEAKAELVRFNSIADEPLKEV